MRGRSDRQLHVSRRPIAVYGATGYTGRRIARDLLASGARVVLAGRSREPLQRLAAELGGAEVRCATLDDPAGLRAVAAGAEVIVNCAGPFAASALPLCAAALECGSHYLDISAEQDSTLAVIEQDAAAKRAGRALLPAIGFYGALADLAVARLVGRDAFEQITVAYSIEGWQPSEATVRSRLDGMAREWLDYDGELVRRRGLPPTTVFDFAGPIGRKRVAVYPTAETVTIPRHTATRRVHTYLTTATLGPEPLGALLPSLANAAGRLLETRAAGLVERGLRVVWRAHAPAAMQSDPTRFAVVVEAARPGAARRATLAGRGIYDVTATLAALAVAQLTGEWDGRAGAFAPAQALAPASVLERLAADGVRCTMDPEPRTA